MGQIVRRKRRGRPSNIDRARWSSQVFSPSPADRRSSRRRRNVRYNFDIDDYVDDNEFEDDEDADIGRREKKLRLLLFEDDSVSNRRVSHAPSSSSEEDDEDYNRKPSKKRKLDREDDEIEEIRRRTLEEDDENEEDEEEEEEAGGSDFDCGTMSDLPKKVPMPDKKTLESILDKLQKKDIYGVYAEPVDPEELPDYHDVIKHPMDFATVRKKLAKGLYLSLKDFESDVFLICTNAMQYNAPDTVYYKQASSIQEQAKLKFQRLRANTDFSEKELKPDYKTTPSFTLPKKQLKKSMVQTAPGPYPDPVETETFSAATVRFEEFPNGSSAQIPARPNSGEVVIAENSSLDDNNLDKDQEPLTGNGLISKHGRKPSVHDEDRRATYNISLEPVTDSDSVFSIFEGESKQFIPVGLHVDHSYARSLARFAATLGPVAWKIASHTIEQALPEGVKFGPGWVGDYEPLPSPVLVPENRTLQEPNFLANFKITSDVKNKQKAFQAPKIHVDVKVANDGFNPGIPVKQESSREPRKDSIQNPSASPSPSPSPRLSPRTSLYSVSNPVHQNISNNFTRPENMGLTRVELNHPPPLHVSSAADFVANGPISDASDIPSKSVSRNGNHASLGSFKQPNSSNDESAPGADFVVKRPISYASDIPYKPVSRNGDLASLGSFKHSNSDNDGFAPGADFVAKRPITNAFDIPSKPVSRNGNLVSLGSFKHPNSYNAGVAPGADFVAKRPISNASDIPSKPVSGNGNLVSFKHPNNNDDGLAHARLSKPGGLDFNKMVHMDSNMTPRQDLQGLSDPVQMMKMLTEKSQHQQNNPNGFGFGSKKNDSNNVALTAAQAWMSLGGAANGGVTKPPLLENRNPHKQQISADSLYNPTRDRPQPQVTRFRVECNNYQQPVRPVNDGQLQNRNVGFPQMVTTADLSRFQVQSGWRGVPPQTQQQFRPKQESRPPDLNIGYQSISSPVRQSAGMLVDSQQPDLALQL